MLRGQNQIPSCCLSVMLSPAKPLDEIQTNSVCEFSQMIDTRHIRRDFHSVAWVMPQGGGGTSGAGGAQVVKYFFQTWSCGISNRGG